MAKLNLVLAALFCFLALSSAAEPRMNDVSTGDLPIESVSTFNPLIELPRADQETTVVPELPESTESTEELTTVAFRHEDRSLDGPRGKRLHHGHRHFKPEEMSFGNDMILSSNHGEGSDDVEEKPERWVKFHHQAGEHEFGDSNGNDDVRRPDHHRRFEREGDDERENHREHHHRHGHFDRDDAEEREGRGQRFDREDDEERDGRHHHRRHHHHRNHDGEEQEEGGVVMKMRKFLMGRHF